MIEKLKIFVINLEKDIKRKEHMENLLNKYNLKYEIVKAVDGNKLTEQELNSLRIDKEGSLKILKRPLKKSEIGCLLSHRKIYEKILTENIQLALILEDDIFFEEDLIDFLKLEDILFPPKWEIILLGSHNDGENIPLDPFKRKKIFKKYEIGIPLFFPYGTHGYLVNKKGAIKLYKNTEVIYKPIDHYTGDLKEINMFIVSPVLIKLEQNIANNSNINLISQKEIEKKETKIQRILKSLKRMIRMLINFIFNHLKCDYFLFFIFITLDFLIIKEHLFLLL